MSCQSDDLCDIITTLNEWSINQSINQSIATAQLCSALLCSAATSSDEFRRNCEWHDSNKVPAIRQLPPSTPSTPQYFISLLLCLLLPRSKSTRKKEKKSYFLKETHPPAIGLLNERTKNKARCNCFLILVLNFSISFSILKIFLIFFF